MKSNTYSILLLLLSTCFGAFIHLYAEKTPQAGAQQAYELHQFKAHNGIRFEYSLLLPSDYQKGNEYKIVAILCEVHKDDNAWEKTMKRLASLNLERTIVLVPKVPIGQDHWGTHPIHHGFNDLLKSVRKSHGTAHQKFHLIGLEAGQETAFWWTAASADLIASTSIINGHLWKEDRWNKKWYNNLSGSHVPIYVYEEVAIDKFDMSAFHFRKQASMAQVIREIEERK